METNNLQTGVIFPKDVCELFGETTQNLSELHKIFSPHTIEELQKKPELCRELFERGNDHIETCRQRLRDYLMEKIFGRKNPHPTREPTDDGIEALRHMINCIALIYPDYKSDKALIQAYFLNPIVWGAFAEVSVRMFEFKNKHAELAVNITKMTAAILPTGPNKQLAIYTEIESIKKFLSKNHILQHQFWYLDVNDISRINNEIFRLINKFHSNDIPLAVSHEKDIFEKPICFVSEPVPSEAAIYGYTDIEMTVYDDFCKEFLETRSGLQFARLRTSLTSGTGDVHKAIIIGESIAFCILRFDGELATHVLPHQALKPLLGGRAYEILRAYILFRYAQLVCDDETFVREFQKFITLNPPPVPQYKQKAASVSQKQSLPSPQEKTQTPEWTQKLPLHIFPEKSRIYLKNLFAAQHVRKPEQVPSSHRSVTRRHTPCFRRMLPPGWEPSEEARKKIEELKEGNPKDNLNYFLEVIYEFYKDGFEFANAEFRASYQIGQKLFTEEKMKQEAKARNISFEAFINFITDQYAYKRQCTFVSGHEIGDIQDGVRAKFRHEDLQLIPRA